MIVKYICTSLPFVRFLHLLPDFESPGISSKSMYQTFEMIFSAKYSIRLIVVLSN